MAYINPNSPLLYFEPSIEQKQQVEIRQVVEDLPANSVVGQWAIGISSSMPPGAVSTELDCYKGWHGWYKNLHATFRLAWVDEHRYFDNHQLRRSALNIYPGTTSGPSQRSTSTRMERSRSRSSLRRCAGSGSVATTIGSAKIQ